MRWAVAFLLLALLVPVLMVLFDVVGARRRRRAVPPEPAVAMTPPPDDLERRLRAIEDDVGDLGREIAELRDELDVVQRQLERRAADPSGRGGADDR